MMAQDSTQSAARWGSAEMRQRIEERFTERVKTELGLTDEQTAKLKRWPATGSTSGGRMEAEERDLRKALPGQLRPGVAANSDSVSRIVNRLLDLKVKYAESYREENKELGFLTPVQRAQYYSLRERLLDALKQARQAPATGRERPEARPPVSCSAGELLLVEPLRPHDRLAGGGGILESPRLRRGALQVLVDLEEVLDLLQVVRRHVVQVVHLVGVGIAEGDRQHLLVGLAAVDQVEEPDRAAPRPGSR